QQLPLVWLAGLAPAGRLLVPLTPRAGEGGMLLVRRTADPTRFDARVLCRVRFVPCIRAQDEAMSARLAAAFGAGDEGTVRSLRLGAAGDREAWFSGEGFWLSSGEA